MDFICKNIGKVNVEINDMSYIFKHYSEEFKNIFMLNEKNFNQIVKFKVQRGGFSIVIKKNQNLIGIFTLSNANNNFLELGDIAKYNLSFSRQTFALILNYVCNWVKTKTNYNGAYAYPNKAALKLEMLAGFKIKYKYKRIIYLVFFNYCILIPFEIVNKKLFLIKNYFKQNIFKTNKNIIATRFKKKGIFKIYKSSKNINKKNSLLKPNFGFLYKFIETDIKGNGDEVIVFSFNNFHSKLDIGFEYTDNSA